MLLIRQQWAHLSCLEEILRQMENQDQQKLRLLPAYLLFEENGAKFSSPKKPNLFDELYQTVGTSLESKIEFKPINIIKIRKRKKKIDNFW